MIVSSINPFPFANDKMKSMLIFLTHINNSKWQPSPFCKSDVIHFCGRGKSLAILDIGSGRESAAYYVINNQHCRWWNVSWNIEKVRNFEKKEVGKIVNIIWTKCCLKIWRKWIIAGKGVRSCPISCHLVTKYLPFSEIRKICIAPFSVRVPSTLCNGTSTRLLSYFCILVKIGNRLWSFGRTTSQ